MGLLFFIYFIFSRPMKTPTLKLVAFMCDLRLSPHCKWDLLFFEILLSVQWHILIDASAKTIPSSKVMQSSWTAWHLKTEPVRCPETLVRNCHSTLRTIPKQGRSHVAFIKKCIFCVINNSCAYLLLNLLMITSTFSTDLTSNLARFIFLVTLQD